MATRIGGLRRNTRYKMKKPVKQRGKMSLRKYFETFEAGQKVVLKAEPSYHDGMYHPRFHGLVGIIDRKESEKYDSCYRVTIKDFTKEKTLIVHPVHLKKLEVSA